MLIIPRILIYRKDMLIRDKRKQSWILTLVHETKCCSILLWREVPAVSPTMTHTPGIMGRKSQPIGSVRYHALPGRSGAVISHDLVSDQARHEVYKYMSWASATY